MGNVKNYRPAQPFFELTTENYVSRLSARQQQLAQYYSFVISPESKESIVAVPDGSIDIVFHCSSSKPQALICGSVKKGKRIEFAKGDLYFGARFYPGMANLLLGCPMDQFTEKEIILSDVQKKADGLAERICSANSFDERVQLFEQFHRNSEEQLSASALVSFILKKINECNGDIRIQELEEETGYSTRYINSCFKKHVGIAPKLFLRIVRFQHCFNTLRSQAHSLNFADLALDAGYYDQAHFINEFKEFSLYTPTQAHSVTLSQDRRGQGQKGSSLRLPDFHLPTHPHIHSLDRNTPLHHRLKS